MNELVTVRNRLNGGVTKVRRNIAEHPIFGANLEIVPPGTKPKVPLKSLNKGEGSTKTTLVEVEPKEESLKEEKK